MRLLLDIVIALVLAIVIGVSTAWYAIEHGFIFGAVTAGAWTAWPTAGSADADPYSLATLARTGEVPLGAGEGIAFTARRRFRRRVPVGDMHLRRGRPDPGRAAVDAHRL